MGSREQTIFRHGLAALVVVVSACLFGFSQSQGPQKQDVAPGPGLSEQKQSKDTGGDVTSRDDTVHHTWQTDKTISSAELPRNFTRAGDTRLKPDSFVTINNKVYPLRTYRMMLNPNDPLENQWWVASSKLSEAWDMTPGTYEATLAIIDSGFGLSHEELDGRWYINSDEIGPSTVEQASLLNCTDQFLPLDYACNLVDDDVDGTVDNESGVAPYENPSRLNCTDAGLSLDRSCNRVDDDQNGYTDDTRGWDAINQDNSVQAGEINPTGSGTTHGTMVAGVAAATGNNAKGIAGVNWQAKILPIQALDDDGYGNTRSVGQAIHYAIDRKVDVINISLGTDFQDDYVREAIEAATSAGIVVVASSGNDGCECVVYPARYPEVVAVGAIDSTGSRASFSSWGASVDIAAPGTNFTLPSWSNTNPTSRYVSDVAGTSFSSPLVAGLVTLMKSHRPEAQPLHLIAALHETADRTLNQPVASPTSQYGYGKVNAVLSRQRMLTAKHVAQSYVLSPVTVGNYFAGQTQTEAPGRYLIHDCQSPTTSLPIYELQNGTIRFFSMSEGEVRRANAMGYNSTNFAYACLAQPQDTADVVRNINIFQEFKNIFSKEW